MKWSIAIVVLGLALGTSACKKTAGESSAAATATDPPAAVIKPKGTLTAQQLRDADKLADKNMTTPWADAWGKVTAALGEPHATDGKKYHWYAMDGASCLELTLEDLGSSAQPTFIGLNTYDSGITQYDACRKAAGAS